MSRGQYLQHLGVQTYNLFYLFSFWFVFGWNYFKFVLVVCLSVCVRMFVSGFFFDFANKVTNGMTFCRNVSTQKKKKKKFLFSQLHSMIYHIILCVIFYILLRDDKLLFLQQKNDTTNKLELYGNGICLWNQFGWHPKLNWLVKYMIGPLI